MQEIDQMAFKINQKTVPPLSMEADSVAIAAFAAGANDKRAALTAEKSWTGADNKRQRSLFSLRLTDYQKAQLDYIAEHGGARSAHAWIITVLAPALEAEAEKLF